MPTNIVIFKDKFPKERTTPDYRKSNFYKKVISEALKDPNDTKYLDLLR